MSEPEWEQQRFAAISDNPDTEQLQEWWRNQRGTPEFLAHLEEELLWRAGVGREKS